MEYIKSDLIRGSIETIVLRCLHGGDMYGLEISNLVRDASGGTYNMKQATLYSCLKRLEKSGMVTGYRKESPNGGVRHYYRLTEKGDASFADKKGDWSYHKDVIDTLVFDRIDAHRHQVVELPSPAADGTQAVAKTQGEKLLFLAGDESANPVEADADTPDTILAKNLELVAANLEQVTANLDALNREQTLRYEQLFERAKQHILSEMPGEFAGVSAEGLRASTDSISPLMPSTLAAASYEDTFNAQSGEAYTTVPLSHEFEEELITAAAEKNDKVDETYTVLEVVERDEKELEEFGKTPRETQDVQIASEYQEIRPYTLNPTPGYADSAYGTQTSAEYADSNFASGTAVATAEYEEPQPYTRLDLPADPGDYKNILQRYISPNEPAHYTPKHAATTQFAVFDRTQPSQILAAAQEPVLEKIEIKPYMKHLDKRVAIRDKDGEFVLYHKLRMFSSLIVALVMSAALYIAHQELKADYTTGENTLFTCSYVILGCYFLFAAAYYAAYPKHKRVVGNTSNDLIRRLLIVLSAAAVVVSINLIVGLTTVDQLDYLVFWAVPCLLCGTVILEGLAIAIMKRLPVFLS